jgi:hypothetical protein
MQLLAILDELLSREVISLAWSRTARSSVRKLAKAYDVPPETLEATPALEKEVLTRLRPYILAQGGAISTAFTQAQIFAGSCGWAGRRGCSTTSSRARPTPLARSH